MTEVGEVLRRLTASPIEDLVAPLRYALRDHDLHLLMPYVEGRPLRHSHVGLTHCNDQEFSQYIDSIPRGVRRKWIETLAVAMRELHSRGLLWADLKTEQLIVTPASTIVAVDVDGIVVSRGLSAQYALWRSAGTLNDGRNTRYSDYVRLGRVAAELLAGAE